MRFFDYLSTQDKQKIFYEYPMYFDRDSDKEILSYALGATLYTPASKGKLVRDIMSNKYTDLMSTVMCLEDAIGDKTVEEAEIILIDQISKLYESISKGDVDYQKIPLIFIRVRSPEQLDYLSKMLGEKQTILTGYVLPKFEAENGYIYLELIKRIAKDIDKKIYAMPILEKKEIIYNDRRQEELEKIAKCLDAYKDIVLNIRIGAADFCRLFGLRRTYDLTIYDIAVVQECISDIINCFIREERDYVVSGPVWEYFHNMSTEIDLLKWVKSFDENYKENIKFDKYTYGLIKETRMDKVNGLIGKTVIHPSQIRHVQSIYIVEYEEYIDALSIIENNNKEIGVIKSEYSNKMNEIKAHINWANKVIRRSKIYGVYNDRKKTRNLLA